MISLRSFWLFIIFEEENKHFLYLLIKDDIGSFDVEQADTRSCSSKLKIAGKMHIVAFLTPRATVGEALAAMRKDIVTSISGRFQMHCQSLQGEEANGLDPSGVSHRELLLFKQCCDTILWLFFRFPPYTNHRGESCSNFPIPTYTSQIIYSQVKKKPFWMLMLFTLILIVKILDRRDPVWLQRLRPGVVRL